MKNFIFHLIVLSGFVISCQTMAKKNVTITRASGGILTLRVDIARTEAEREMGLMFRKHFSDDEGMLFIFPIETQTSFWMKDTPISLDILFIRGDRIVEILEKTTPYSEDLLTPKSTYNQVLEVPGGYISRHKISMGDRVN